MFTIFTISMLVVVSLAAKRPIAFCGRKSASIQKSRLKQPLPVSLPHTLVLATMTHLSRVEKFVKRFHPLQQGDHRDSFWLTKQMHVPPPGNANRAS